MSDAGLTLTQQPPLSSATVALDAPVGEVWQRIAATDDFQQALKTGVNELVGHLHAGQRAFALEQHGVTALDGFYASAVAALVDADPIREQRREQALRLTEEFGAAERSVVGLHAPVEEIADGPLAVLRTSEVTPTLAIRVGDEFVGLRAGQQREVIDLLADLASAIDLRIVATGRWQRKLAQEYREDLPGVSEQCSAGSTVGDIAETVEQAREALEPDGRKVRILRQLAEQTSETLSYHELYALHDVTDGTVKQCLTTSDPSLSDLGLVETFSRATDRGNAAELLAAGREFLDHLDSEIGRQQRLDAVVSETGNPNDNCRVTPPAHEGRHSHRPRLPHYHQLRDVARHRYAAAAGSAVEGGISLVDHPIPEKEKDRAEPHWYYDDKSDRLLVGAEYDNPLSWWTCIALALANPRTFRHVLTPERIESEKLGDLLANHTDLLRDSRCLGYLADSNATAEDYRAALLEAAEDLRDLTKDLYHGNFEDETRFRGEITREALGLAGTMVHLLDLAGVELVREARIPRYSRDFKESQKADLAKTLAIGASIQSKYGDFAAFRQLFEDREDKRTFPPTVDADDPFGECIGSFVLIGKSIEGFADRLRRRLANRETHEDAPEFAVEVPVEVATDRQHVAHTVREMCRQKSIRPTREATSMLAALTGTPYDVGEALHNLAPERRAPTRELNLDEVRYVLSTLDAKRIVPKMAKPSLSKVVHTLLVADTPLVQSELAERADVSARSIRTHTDRLKAFDFIRETDEGWRFALPLRGEDEYDERGEDILPWFVTTGNDEQEREQDALVREVVAEAVYDLVDGEQYADPDDPVGGALFGPPGERIPALREAWEWLDPWISVIRVLCDDNSDCAHAADTDKSGCSGTVAMVGEQPKQASLTNGSVVS